MLTVILCLKPMRIPKFIWFKIMRLIPGEQFKYGYEIVSGLPRRLIVIEMTESDNFKNIKNPTEEEIYYAIKRISDLTILEPYVNEDNVNRIAAAACRKGQVEFVKHLIEKRGAKNFNKFFRTSCSAGSLELVKYFMELGVINAIEGIRKALKGRDTDDVIFYLLDKLPPGAVYKTFNFSYASRAVADCIMQKYGIYCKRQKRATTTSEFATAIQSCDYNIIDATFSNYNNEILLFSATPRLLEFILYAEQKYGVMFDSMTFLMAAAFSPELLDNYSSHDICYTAQRAYSDELYDLVIKRGLEVDYHGGYIRSSHQLQCYYDIVGGLDFCVRSAIHNDFFWFIKKYVEKIVSGAEYYIQIAINVGKIDIAYFLLGKFPTVARLAILWAIDNNEIIMAKDLVIRYNLDCSESFYHYCLGDEIYLEMILFLKENSVNLNEVRAAAKKRGLGYVLINIKD